ncbi:MAG: AbrB/MazE/SpoVT family DNA-binding domain-containing protein [Caulobacteraceae bacterium]|nr:AbrB/MazE/SpoVT family DNA-binding domain-containing protein [Caulobacteraceae bacterium]
MKVAKWGNSLAVRLPADVVEAMHLKPGDEIEITAATDRGLEIARPLSREELIKSLRKFRGMVPADFKFNRDEAHER